MILLGDLVAALAKLLMIRETKQCGCKTRQEKLNDWDLRLRDRIKKLFKSW